MSDNNNYDGDLEKFIRKLFANKNKKKDVTPQGEQSSEPIIEKTKKPMNMRQWLASGIVLTVIFAAFVILLANVYVVKENEYKVVRQFGEVVKFEREPGMHMKIPFIQSVTTLPKNLMTYDMTKEEINTRDKKRIIIDNYAIWRVTDPKALISNAGQLGNAENRMEEFIYSIIHIVFSSFILRNSSTAPRGIPFAGSAQNAARSAAVKPGWEAANDFSAVRARSSEERPPERQTSHVPQSQDSSWPKYFRRKRERHNSF